MGSQIRAGGPRLSALTDASTGVLRHPLSFFFNTWVGIVLGGNCSGGELSWVGIKLDVYYLGLEFS